MPHPALDARCFGDFTCSTAQCIIQTVVRCIGLVSFFYFCFLFVFCFRSLYVGLLFDAAGGSLLGLFSIGNDMQTRHGYVLKRFYPLLLLLSFSSFLLFLLVLIFFLQCLACFTVFGIFGIFGAFGVFFSSFVFLYSLLFFFSFPFLTIFFFPFVYLHSFFLFFFLSFLLACLRL